MNETLSDPAVMTSDTAQGRLGALMSRGVPESDARVVECRESLAYHRVLRAIDSEGARLSRPTVERLVEALRAVTR